MIRLDGDIRGLIADYIKCAAANRYTLYGMAAISTSIISSAFDHHLGSHLENLLMITGTSCALVTELGLSTLRSYLHFKKRLSAGQEIPDSRQDLIHQVGRYYCYRRGVELAAREIGDEALEQEIISIMPEKYGGRIEIIEGIPVIILIEDKEKFDEELML